MPEPDTLPPSTFAVDDRLKPRLASIPALDGDGGERTIAA
jgi:hypothetical protein